MSEVSVSEKKVEIRDLIVRIGKKEIKLKLNEAEKLHEALVDLFSKKEIIREEHHHHDHWCWPKWIYNPGYTWEIGKFTAPLPGGATIYSDNNVTNQVANTGYLTIS